MDVEGIEKEKVNNFDTKEMVVKTMYVAFDIALIVFQDVVLFNDTIHNNI